MSAKIPKQLRTVLLAALSAALVLLAIRYLVPYTAPLLVALATACLLEGAVRFLCSRARLPRPAAAGLCVMLLLGAVSAVLWLACTRLLAEGRALLERLPELIETVSATLAGWRERLSGYLGADGYFGRMADAVAARLREVPAGLSGEILSRIPKTAAATPDVLMFAVTAIIGAYFISSSFPQLMHFFALQLPERARERARVIRRDLRDTLGRWLRAQLIMLLITFCELTIAFLLLGISYAFLLALFTAVIDALPVLGTGTVLLPWAVYDLLTGATAEGVGLVITYVAVTVLRSCIQAKLLGDQLGLHPLATLAAIYIGYRAWGVAGMIVLPIVAISLSRLNDSRLIHLWKTPESSGKGGKHDRNHIQYHSGHGDEYPGRDEYPAR